MSSNRKVNPPAEKPRNLPADAIGNVASTVVKATQQPGTVVDLGKRLVDLANQPKNPTGR